ncbi:hypothetical protein MANES_18G016400v8 [Manihot esculenta]|uniref:Uncharacterized protein n=1 Tax=Manihot esculenta TaxID=3983 RepID=A0ACB7FX38_MANES|nr:hypothetical protein MANES_18G016400v8 [Manihot esculenta]
MMRNINYHSYPCLMHICADYMCSDTTTVGFNYKLLIVVVFPPFLPHRLWVFDSAEFNSNSILRPCFVQSNLLRGKNVAD